MESALIVLNMNVPRIMGKGVMLMYAFKSKLLRKMANALTANLAVNQMFPKEYVLN